MPYPEIGTLPISMRAARRAHRRPGVHTAALAREQLLGFHEVVLAAPQRVVGVESDHIELVALPCEGRYRG